MALEAHEILTDIDLHGNEILNAKVPEITALTPSENIVNKEYVDSKGFLDTTESELYDTAKNAVGGLEVGETVHESSINEIVSKMLFGAKVTPYYLPTFASSFVESSFVLPLIFEVGSTVSVPFSHVLDLKDSSGVATNGLQVIINNVTMFSGNTTLQTISYNVSEAQNSVKTRLNYLQSIVKQNNLGENDTVNSFLSGSIETQNKNFIFGVWPIFLRTATTNETVTTDAINVRFSALYQNGKKVVRFDKDTEYCFISNIGDRFISILLPKLYTNTKLTIYKDSIDITNAFIKTDFLMNDLLLTGRTKAYSLYRLTYAMPLSIEACYTLKMYSF